MAALDGSHADEGYASTGGPKDGPVLTMMSKRLRALRKKFNRILQIEENKAQGKIVNKEQEEVLKTKIAIATLIDEYEKLRQPLVIAVKEEVAEKQRELLAASLERQGDVTSVTDDKAADQKGVGVATPHAENTQKENCGVHKEEQRSEDVAGLANELSDDGTANFQDVEDADSGSQFRDEDTEERVIPSKEPLTDSQIGDLLTLLYFSQLFDVRSPGETPAFVWTKVHERSSCLSYDFVRDDVTTPLVEGDLDALSILGSLLTTRPPNVTLSHKEALEKCVKHARAWLVCSQDLIGESYSELSFSYSGLRERLDRILSSEYFCMTPELTTVSQQTAAAAATAAGQYVTKLLVHEASVGVVNPGVADDSDFRQDEAVPAQCFQARDYAPGVSLVTDGVPGPLLGMTNDVPFVAETLCGAVDLPQFGSRDSPDDGNEVSPDTDALTEHECPITQSLPTQQAQPQNQAYYSGGHRVGGYQNPRGKLNYSGGRGRGVFPSARGARAGRSGHPNGGRSVGERHFYDQGGHHPRNQNHYIGGRVGRGPRGGHHSYNGQQHGPARSISSPVVATGSA